MGEVPSHGRDHSERRSPFDLHPPIFRHLPSDWLALPVFDEWRFCERWEQCTTRSDEFDESDRKSPPPTPIETPVTQLSTPGVTPDQNICSLMQCWNEAKYCSASSYSSLFFKKLVSRDYGCQMLLLESYTWAACFSGSVCRAGESGFYLFCRFGNWCVQMDKHWGRMGAHRGNAGKHWSTHGKFLKGENLLNSHSLQFSSTLFVLPFFIGKLSQELFTVELGKKKENPCIPHT